MGISFCRHCEKRSAEAIPQRSPTARAPTTSGPPNPTPSCPTLSRASTTSIPPKHRHRPPSAKTTNPRNATLPETPPQAPTGTPPCRTTPTNKPVPNAPPAPIMSAQEPSQRPARGQAPATIHPPPPCRRRPASRLSFLSSRTHRRTIPAPHTLHPVMPAHAGIHVLSSCPPLQPPKSAPGRCPPSPATLRAGPTPHPHPSIQPKSPANGPPEDRLQPPSTHPRHAGAGWHPCLIFLPVSPTPKRRAPDAASPRRQPPPPAPAPPHERANPGQGLRPGNAHGDQEGGS